MALVICDVWDRHWSSGATDRVNSLAPRIDNFCRELRDAGALIVHAPSETIGAYTGTPARQRIEGVIKEGPPEYVAIPPLPIDAEGGGSDSEDSFPPETQVWSRQHDAIMIDDSCDVVTDDGGELATYLRASGRRTVLVAGVHTNMCILERSFGLRALVGWGFSAALVADLTDAMYDPARSPYVSHEEGTELVVRYIEAFVAPTTTSPDMALCRAAS
jgi:nicotinamidase-related amidase